MLHSRPDTLRRERVRSRRYSSKHHYQTAGKMAQSVGSYTNPLKKFKLVFLGEQSGMRYCHNCVYHPL